MPYFGLFLSDMRVGNFLESDRLAAWSPNREDLEKLLELEKVAPYQDGTYSKTFRAGGPLEWFNDTQVRPPGRLGIFVIVEGAPKIEEIRTRQEYMNHYGELYDRMMADVYRADVIDEEPIRGVPALGSGT